MKLTIVTNILAPYRIPLFEAIQQRVDELTVVLMAQGHEDRQWGLDSHHFKSIVLPGFHFRLPGRQASVHWNYHVIRTLRRLNPDVVISGGFAPANIAAFIYCRLFRRRYIGWGEFTLRDGAQHSIVKRLIRRCLTSRSDASIASSTVAREAFIHYGARPEQVLVSLMPIDVDKFNRLTRTFRCSPDHANLRNAYTHPILLSIGRLIGIKGYYELFDIYERILTRHCDAALIMVGDGVDRESYQERALCGFRASR
jgi:glycosyltransferase involved in cell wall biosynthesis